MKAKMMALAAVLLGTVTGFAIELPEFDAAKVTGDELVKICNQLKRGLSDTIYQDLNALLLDRELTFNDVQVIEARERADGFTDVSCCVGSLMPMLWVYSKESCLCLVARVPTKSIDALPWGFTGKRRRT